MILLQASTCVLFLLSGIIQCQSAAPPATEPGQQGKPGEQASNEVSQSGPTGIKEEIELMAKRFSEEKVQQCCRDSLQHYESTQNCNEKPKGMTEDENSECFKAFQQCCQHVKSSSQTPSFFHSASMMDSGVQTEGESEQQTEGFPEGLTEGESEGITEDMPEGITEDMPEGMTDDMPEGLTDDMLEEELSEEEPEGLSEGESEELTEDMPEGLSEGESEGESEELTDEEPELSEEDSEEDPDWLPEGQTEEDLDELTEDETDLTEEEEPELTEVEPEMTEGEPGEELDELTDEDLEEQLDQEDYSEEEGEPLLSLQLSMQVSKPSGEGVKTGVDIKSPINSANQQVLENSQSGQPSLEEK